MDTRRIAEGETSGPEVGVAGRLHGVELPYDTAAGGRLNDVFCEDLSPEGPSAVDIVDRDGVEGRTFAQIQAATSRGMRTWPLMVSLAQ
eukprot:Skav205722  [mRNA]  locus=scaffold1496:76095:77095:- [translate_table: standard]